MSTDPTQQPIAEEYALANGEGLIDVRGDGAESALVVEDRPMAIVWPDYLGSRKSAFQAYVEAAGS